MCNYQHKEVIITLRPAQHEKTRVPGFGIFAKNLLSQPTPQKVKITSLEIVVIHWSKRKVYQLRGDS